MLVVVIPAGVTLGGAALVYLNATRSIPTPEDSFSVNPRSEEHTSELQSQR